jgi:hypothetical protein
VLFVSLLTAHLQESQAPNRAFAELRPEDASDIKERLGSLSQRLDKE